MGVQKRLRNGKVRWVARYRDPGGKEHSKTFDREKDGKLWLADQQVKLASGTWIDPASSALTVGQLYDEWMASEFRRSNTEAARKYTRNVMLPPLKHLPAASLTSVQVRQWYDQMCKGRPWRGSKDKGVALSTANACLSHLRSAFAHGVNSGLVVRNPVKSAPRLASAVERSDIPTSKEIDAVIDALREGGYTYRDRGKKFVSRPAPDYADAMVVGKLTGMRASEVLALSDEDVDLDAMAIRVTAQADKRGERVPLKTAAGRRQIPITPELWETLQPRLGRGRLFRNQRGTVARYEDVCRFIIYARRGNERVHFHALRHFFASQLLANGLPAADVAALLGHSSPAVTLGIYAHAVEGSTERARDAITAALSCGTGAGRGHLRVVDNGGFAQAN